MTTTAAKVWLVTGASSGLGKATVEYVLSKGGKVAATCRKDSDLADLQSKFPASQFLVFRLDVTSSKDVEAVFAKAVEAFGRIDVVYNNAGYVVVGEFESTSDEVARKQFEVNFWGAVTVTREAVKVFRDVNKPVGGVLLQASSGSAILSTEVAGFYSASKAALESITEALAKEVDPSWNIRVKSIEFGPFSTRALTANSAVVVPPHPAYASLPPDSSIVQTRAFFASNPAMSNDPAKAARELYNIAEDSTVTAVRIPLAQEALQATEKRIEDTKESVAQAAKFSQDLKHD